MNNELIKRYIYAVIFHLPVKSQTEVEKEIESMITDMLYARCGDKEPTDNDVRDVLTELGLPEELAVKYSGDENKALISGVYYLWFKKILLIVLPIAAAGVAFATLLEHFVNQQVFTIFNGITLNLIFTVLAGSFSAAIQAFVWVTVIFVILERKKVNFSDDEFLNRLRPVPDTRAQIKLSEPVSNIILQVIFTTLFLGAPFLIGFYSNNLGWIPVFNESYIHSVWYLFILSLAMNIIRESFKLIDRRYSKRLAIITVFTQLFSGLFTFLFFSNKALFNPIFYESMYKLSGAADNVNIGWVFNNAGSLFAGVIIFAVLLDIAVTCYRAIKYD